MWRRSERRPGEPGTWRDIPGLRRNGLQKLQIVADPHVQRETGRRLKLILSVETDVRISLPDLCHTESLRETGVVISAAQEISQGREHITSADRARIGDAIGVVEEIDTGANGFSSFLDGNAVGTLIQAI